MTPSIVFTWFIMLVVFIFGTIIGSFLNVVVLRHNSGKGLNGRSICFSCQKNLHWYELVPLISYLHLNGKCSICRAKISKQYFWVELTTGLLFLLSFLTLYPLITQGILTLVVSLLFYWVAIALLVCILVYDWQHQIIPNVWNWSFIFLAVLWQIWQVLVSGAWQVLAVNLIFAGLLTAPFALMWLLSKGKWMGFGDVKLILGIALWLGIYAWSAVVLAFWIGTIVIMLVLLFQKHKIKRGLKIPFAPFLVAGFLIILFLHWDFFRLQNVMDLLTGEIYK